MQVLSKSLIMILIAAMAGVVGHWLAPTPEICFAAGSETYRLSAHERPADYRVAINNAAARPDLRVRLVDRVEAADFALIDDTGALPGSACRSAGPIRTVRVVELGTPADITIAVSPRPHEVDFSLYVQSARVSHVDAAALFALIRQRSTVGREHDSDPLDGDHVAAIP